MIDLIQYYYYQIYLAVNFSKNLWRILIHSQLNAPKFSQKYIQCKFLLNFVSIMKLIHNFIWSEREGDFLFHIKAIKALLVLPVFRGRDSSNYLRYGSFYLELLIGLKHTNPELYDFSGENTLLLNESLGHLVRLHLIWLLSKQYKEVLSGIIGKTKTNEYMAEWELI